MVIENHESTGSRFQYSFRALPHLLQTPASLSFVNSRGRSHPIPPTEGGMNLFISRQAAKNFRQPAHDLRQAKSTLPRSWQQAVEDLDSPPAAAVEREV